MSSLKLFFYFLKALRHKFFQLWSDDTSSILKAVQKIQKATVKLAKQDETLQEICNEIKNSESQKGCDFVAIQLIQRDQNVIGIVSGTNWSGIAKHYLDVDPKLRDIQADIVKTGQMEIIAGWDARFDEWIYKKYEHFRLARIFMPIIIVALVSSS